MNWSAASSRASASDSSSTTSGDDNEPLTIQDIEKWHNRTTMQQNQSSFNTGTSTLENNTIGTNDTAEEDEQNNNTTNNNNNNRGTVGGGETEGSSSPELDLSAVSAEGGNNDGGNDDNNNNNKSNNGGNRSPRQVVAGLPWRDSNGNDGMYTGEVNSSNVPDGLGLLRYNKQQQQQQEGEWNNGKLIRRKSQHKDANALSTIEEEKSVKAPSIKYTEEFANFLAAKQIGIIGYDNHSQSSNSMDAHTTGEQSNARDFADSGLFSSTSTRQSNLWASTNSRKSHIYSSTNSRPTSAEFVSSTMSSTPELHQQQHHHHQQQEKQHAQQQQQRQQEEKQQQQQQQQEKQKKQQQPIFREKNQLERSRDETTTFEGSESESDRNSISSSDYDHRNSQQQQQFQQYHHEELGLVAVKEEERGSDGNSYRSGSGRGDYNRGDNHHHHDDEKRDHRRDKKVHSYRNGSGRGDNRDDDHHDEKMDHRRDKNVPHDAVHAIKKLMANENEYESEEDSDDEHDNDGVVKRAPPPQDRRGSLNSAMFNWHLDPDEKDSDDDEMRPSLDTHLQSEQQQQQQQKGKKEKSRRDSNLNPYDDDLDSKGGSRFRKRKWCYLFSACCVLSIVGIALISWALVRMRTNSTNDANNDVLNSQPREKDDTGTKVSLSWTLEKDVPCAHITIDIVTDQYGNETTWALYHLANVNNETSMLQATRSSLTEVGHRKRLRPVALSDSNRKMEDSQVKSGGPYTYTSDAGANYTSPVYTSSVCLPEGNYKFVMSDVNGMCCQNGLGQYSIYFNGGRTVHAATGVFMGEEITPFEVTRDDVLVALRSASPSQSMSPSTTVISSWLLNMTTTDDIIAGTGNAYGLVFDVEMHQHLPSLTVMGIDILLNTDGPVSYEISTKEGSWRDLDMSSAADFQQSFRTVASGTTSESGLVQIQMTDFEHVVLSNTERRQAFWIALNGEGLVYKNYDEGTVGSADEIKQKSSSEFELYYGRAIMHYPFVNPRQDFREQKGFVGRLWYSLDSPSPSPTVVSDNDSVSLAFQSYQPTLSNSTGATSQPSMISSHVATENPMTPSFAPSIAVSSASMSPSSRVSNTTTSHPSMLSNNTSSMSPSSKVSNITTSQPSILSNNKEANSTTSQPSSSLTFTTSDFPSFSPSQSPTQRYLESATPTATSPPSAIGQINIKLLDSLSIPYSLYHILEGETYTYTTSRRLQDESADSLFGFSTAVSADMSVLAVGATNALDDYGNHTGAVFLYAVDSSDAGSVPTLVQVLFGFSAQDEFGNDVALSDDGSRLVVAARSENVQEGAIRIYERTSGTNEWYLLGTIVGAGEGFRAGWSVAISGDGNVVAMGSTKGGSEQGGIVSTYVAPDWRLYGSIIEAQTPRDVTGFSVSINGDGTMVAVGSVKASNPDKVSNAGRAGVYAFNGTAWNAEFKVFGDVRQGYDGSSVALSSDGSIFVVGGRGHADTDESEPAVGRCRIFERTGTGEYELLHTIFGKNEREELGWSAAISGDGNKVACGGQGGKMFDFGGTGVVRVWDRLSLQESEVLPRGERFSSVEGASFGSSVSLSSDGSSLVVGASTWIGTGISSSASGAVQIFGDEPRSATLSTQPTVPSTAYAANVTSSPSTEIGFEPTGSPTVSANVTSSSPTTRGNPTISPTVYTVNATSSPTTGSNQTISPTVYAVNLTSSPTTGSNSTVSPTAYVANVTSSPTNESRPTLSPSTANVTSSSPTVGSVSEPTISPTANLTSSSPTTEIRPSSIPTATALPTAMPTVFDPLVDVELLDSLSSPYTMTRLIQGEVADSLFGFSTAMSADMSVLAVGATNALDDNGDRTGAVFLYSIDTSDAGSIPTLVQVLYGTSPEDEFGSDLALSDNGNTLVVAARSEKAQEGAIRMYNLLRGTDDDSGLFWELSGTVIGDGEGFRAGWSVAISGDGNVVAMGSTKGGSEQGGIVSTYVAPDWLLYGSIIEAQTPRDVTGFSVSLNGDGTVIAVGSVKASNPEQVSNAGRAGVFAFNGTAWNAEFKVFGEMRQGYDGSSVALSSDGNIFVVGGRGHADTDESEPAVGRCRIFERTGTGEYELLHTIFGKNEREELGWSAAISGDGNKVACGGQDGKMFDFGGTGVVRVWDRLSLQESEVLPRGERFSSVEGASFGSSVSLSSDGSSLVVGASTWNGGNVTSPGCIFSFSTS